MEEPYHGGRAREENPRRKRNGGEGEGVENIGERFAEPLLKQSERAGHGGQRG